MWSHMTRLPVLIAVVLVGAVLGGTPVSAEEVPEPLDACGAGGFPTGGFVSASTVEQLGPDLSSVQPEVNHTYTGDPLEPADYLKPMGPLGATGPIGPWGPLGIVGPVGKEMWNPRNGSPARSAGVGSRKYSAGGTGR